MTRRLRILLFSGIVLAAAAPGAFALTMHVVPRSEEPTTNEHPTEPGALKLDETPRLDDKAADERTADEEAALLTALQAGKSVTVVSVGTHLVVTSVGSAAATTGTTGLAGVTGGTTLTVATLPTTATAAAIAEGGEHFQTAAGLTFEEPFGGVEGTGVGTPPAAAPGPESAAGSPETPGGLTKQSVAAAVRAKAQKVSRTLPNNAQWLFVPTDRAAPPPDPKPNPFHITLAADIYDTRNNNPVRTLRETSSGTFYQENTSLSYDETLADGRQVTGALVGRLTNDPQLITGAKGKDFTIQSEPFVQLSKGGDYVARFGVIAPQFTPYTFLSSGLGTHLSKQYKHDNEVTEFQFFAAELDRRNSPSLRERVGSGIRVSNLWDMKGDGVLEVGGQTVALHDDPDSVTEPFTGIAFDRNSVGSLNMAYDHPHGYHFVAEQAYSDSEINNAQLATQTFNTGKAERQGFAYKDPQTGRGIRFEHERVDDTFVAVKGAEGDDLDHQAVIADFPVNSKANLTASFDRVYNDIHRQLVTRSQNKSFQLDAGLDPFNTDRNRYVKGLHFDLGGVFSKSDSEDRTLDTFNREWKVVVAERVGRFAASYNFAPRQELEYNSLADTWNRNKSTYQVEYTILGDKNGYWSVHPVISYTRDHNRNDATFVSDLEDNVNLSLDGKYGRNTFGASHGSDRAHLFTNPANTSRQNTQLNFQRAFDVQGNTKASLTYNINQNTDSNQTALTDHKILASISQRW